MRHVGAGSCFVELYGDMLPRRLAAVIRGQMADELAHVGERGNRRHFRDDERTRTNRGAYATGLWVLKALS